MPLPVYKRTIKGWRLEGNDAWVMPAADQSDAWDLLPDSEWERIGALFEAAIPRGVVIDVLPGERAYEQWKADRQEAMR